MVEFLTNYWAVLIGLFAFFAIAAYSIYVFIKMPTTTQIEKIREWLLYAVTEAEKHFGSKTGQIKLRYVYDNFLTKFPYLAKTITFDSFSMLVDESLEKFETLLRSNAALRDYIGNKDGEK